MTDLATTGVDIDAPITDDELGELDRLTHIEASRFRYGIQLGPVETVGTVRRHYHNGEPGARVLEPMPMFAFVSFLAESTTDLATTTPQLSNTAVWAVHGLELLSTEQLTLAWRRSAELSRAFLREQILRSGSAKSGGLEHLTDEELLQGWRRSAEVQRAYLCEQIVREERRR